MRCSTDPRSGLGLLPDSSTRTERTGPPSGQRTAHSWAEAVLNELDPDNESANYRVWLAGPHLFGQGYGTEITRLVIDFARWAPLACTG
jgi:hypothetical protein